MAPALFLIHQLHMYRHLNAGKLSTVADHKSRTISLSPRSIQWLWILDSLKWLPSQPCVCERERAASVLHSCGWGGPWGVGAGGRMWTGCWMAGLEELLALSLGPGKCPGPSPCLCPYSAAIKKQPEKHIMAFWWHSFISSNTGWLRQAWVHC